jgi:hypothetical protein
MKGTYEMVVAFSVDLVDARHYGRQGLPRMEDALGEGPVALRETFPECNSRGRESGEALHGEAAFPESRKSHTQGRFHRET